MKSDGIIKKSDGVLEVVRHLKRNIKRKKGAVSYELKWRNFQIETCAKNWFKKPPKKTCLAFESPKKIKGQQSAMNNTRKGMGDNAVKLINAYVVKKKPQAVDKNYK